MSHGSPLRHSLMGASADAGQAFTVPVMTARHTWQELPGKGNFEKTRLSLRDLRGHIAHPGPRSTVMGEGKRKTIDVGLCLYWGPGGVLRVSPLQFLLANSKHKNGN